MVVASYTLHTYLGSGSLGYGGAICSDAMKKKKHLCLKKKKKFFFFFLIATHLKEITS